MLKYPTTSRLFLLFGALYLSPLHCNEGADNPSNSAELTLTPEPFFTKPVDNVTPPPPEKPFSPFTGKIKGRKVRMRVAPDLDSKIVRELTGSDLLLVVGEKGDFYAVEPPADVKTYVFRSFVLDGVVEANRVNVRLEPSLDAPVVGHVNAGEQLKGSLSAAHPKWYEIAPPAGTRFYVAKEYLQSVGGPEVKASLDRRRSSAHQLLDAATLLTQVEMKKPFSEMDIARIQHSYQNLIEEFEDLPELCATAKERLHNIQEEYSERKLAFLENQGKVESTQGSPQTLTTTMNPTDRMKMWEPLEESLYLAWAVQHDDRSMDEFYENEKGQASVISGFVEPYTSPVRQKPGDYLLKNGDKVVAYLYSTQVNLHDYIGKNISLTVTSRPNNHFAFPAYFVLSAE